MTYTIVNYPGTIYSSIEMDGLDKETLLQIADKYINDSKNSDDFNKFIKAFIIDGLPLSKVLLATGLKESTCSAWASDLIPAIANDFKKFKLEHARNQKQEVNSSSNNSGFDIYKYTEEFDADYYDMHTGYIYLVQEYNRARKFGLPVHGIRIIDNGQVIGYARKLDE